MWGKLIFSLALLIGVSRFLYNKLWLYPGSKTIPIYTKWGENLDFSNILQEYPRPQFVRKSYLNLNGIWEYAITQKNEQPKNFSGQIVVPFSIEAPLSKVNKTLKKDEVLWYKTNINFKNFKNLGLILLNFGAVDQKCEVYINNKLVGKHEGGYTPFTFDITNYINLKSNSNELIVKVIDNLDLDGESFGKQYKYRGNIWYTPTSGIWQTVWIESVPESYLKQVLIKPLYDESCVLFTPLIHGKKPSIFKIRIIDELNNTISERNFDLNKNNIKFKIQNFHPWSPESPYLYRVKFLYGEDEVDSYFGMRKFSIEKDNSGIKRLFLNNKPYFHNGVLDQGYWPDGLYTAPTDEALKNDIIIMKELGFNMLRKHIKIEPLRWYYQCDKIGMIVWQDMVNGGIQPYGALATLIFPNLGLSNIPDNFYSIFGRKNEISRNNYYKELKEMINLLYNTVSISTWVLFNLYQL